MTKKTRAKIPSPRERPFLWGIFLFAAFMLGWTACGGKLPEQDVVLYNRTASLPLGFYLRIPFAASRGDLVTYDPPEDVLAFSYAHGYMEHEKAIFLKRIGAMAGDTYGVDKNGNFYVDGNYVGPVSITDSKGKPLPQIERGVLHTVPEGEFLPLGDSTQSFDGRYTGTVSLSRIQSRVVPLLAFW